MYTYTDRVNYLDILKNTGAHLQNNRKKIKSSAGFKYKEIVSALARKIKIKRVLVSESQSVIKNLEFEPI